MSKKTKERIIMTINDLVENYLSLREQARATYDRADRMLNKIRLLMDVGDISTVDDKEYTLVDNFADNKNLVFRAASFRRFEIREAKKAVSEDTEN